MMSNKDIIVRHKKVSNFSSPEKVNEASIVNGNPTGVINHTNPTRKWSVSLYDLMLNYNWHHSEAMVGGDKVRYAMLSESNRRAYDRALAQLIANDSLQTNQLVDSIMGYITDPLVVTALVRQAGEEAHHSRSYAVMAEDVCSDPDSIYNLSQTDPDLIRKNNAVEKMYATINDNDVVTVHDYQMACAANQILEGLVFPGGFVTMWALASKMPGTAKMIAFIERDEAGTHVPLFRNIYRDVVKKFGLDDETKEDILAMIANMCDEEKIWTKKLTKELLGFTPTLVDMFIENMANEVCANLKLPLLYTKTDGGQLQRLYSTNSMLSSSKNRTNFFEQAVGDYSIGGLDTDY